MPLFMLWKLRHICMCGRSVEGPGDQAGLPNNVSSHEFHSPAAYFNSHLFQPHKRVEFHSYFPNLYDELLQQKSKHLKSLSVPPVCP